jgi:hypothetical protein
LEEFGTEFANGTKGTGYEGEDFAKTVCKRNAGFVYYYSH